MEISKLRSYVIECRGLEEMKQAFDKLKFIGEPMARDECDYQVAKGLRFDIKLHAWRDAWLDQGPTILVMSCADFLATRIKAYREDAHRGQLRKQIIGPFTSRGEMKEVWELLRLYGEDTSLDDFDYPCACNLRVHPGLGWGSTVRKGTMTPSELKLFLRSGLIPVYKAPSKVGVYELRKHVIGPFKSLDEMRDAWCLLKTLGEPTAQGTFNYTKPYNFRFLNLGAIGWGTAGDPGTMTLQELICFINEVGVLEPVASVSEPGEIVVKPDHDCSRHWYASLGCCVKCNKDLDPRNKKDLYGILDEERRRQEFIAEVKRGRK